MASGSAKSVDSKKLLVLDVKGFLIDTYQRSEVIPDLSWDTMVNHFYGRHGQLPWKTVYKRPYCDEFLQFCLDHFIVGIWSAAREYNVRGFIDFLFSERKEELAFVWHQEHCTKTGLQHPENARKPVFLKDLNKLWESTQDNLPWTEGEFGSHNTLLIDDSAYKAILNPEHTGIFPKVYKVTGRSVEGESSCLGLLELQSYLKGLYESSDVQQYVAANPIGNPGVDEILRDPLWQGIVDACSLNATNTSDSTFSPFSNLVSLVGEPCPKKKIMFKRESDDLRIPVQLDYNEYSTWAPANSVVADFGDSDGYSPPEEEHNDYDERVLNSSPAQSSANLEAHRWRGSSVTKKRPRDQCEALANSSDDE